MRSLLAKLEAMFAATAFAEEGDAETARQLMKPDEAERPPRERARPEPRVDASASPPPRVLPAHRRARLG